MNNITKLTVCMLLVLHLGYASDHGPFHRSKIPFLYFGNEDHAAYHKPTDEFMDVTPNFYKKAVKIIISLFKDLDLKGL